MDNEYWILLDTETTGLREPIYVLELAAQRMRGWYPDGEPFRKFLNHNQEIPAEATRVHGYTREVLERDGELPQYVYGSFAQYVGNLPLVSYNLEYDWDEVLCPEWRRLGIAQIGRRGLCALRLAQRLLDPVPAGNCKLQTLRQYYRLPERGAHTALGDVQTVSDLFANVLRPIAVHRGLNSWKELVAYAAEEWYPSRIAFGKHKGRLIHEARKDTALRRWLEWLAGSSSPRTARMGRWYLRQLEIEKDSLADTVIFTPEIDSERQKISTKMGVVALIIYLNPELQQLQQLVAGARARLAELEAQYTTIKSRVSAVQAALFRRLHGHYQKRDQLRLLVDYRKKYLEFLVLDGEEKAKQAESNYTKAKAQTDKDYEESAAAIAEKKELSADEEAELNQLWRKLVKLYHPDRFSIEPAKLDAYGKLTAAINRAKEECDIRTLREIAKDPAKFVLEQGWTGLDFTDEVELIKLRQLHESLQTEIIGIIESLAQLRESDEYELSVIIEQKPSVLDELVAKKTIILEKECAELQRQADTLSTEIKELCGHANNLSTSAP